jgi:transposase
LPEGHEVCDIARFASVGDFSSYCRCVRSVHESNHKKKGEGNTKNGNEYLSWAFVEAAHCALRSCLQAKRFYERKQRQRDGREQSPGPQARARVFSHPAHGQAF